MFKFFKDKLKKALKKVSSSAEEDTEKVEKEVEVKEEVKKEEKPKVAKKPAVDKSAKEDLSRSSEASSEKKKLEEKKKAQEEKKKKLAEEKKKADEEKKKLEEQKKKEVEEQKKLEKEKKDAQKLETEDKKKKQEELAEKEKQLAEEKQRQEEEQKRIEEEEKKRLEEEAELKKEEEQTKEEEKKKKGLFSRLFKKKEKKEEKVEEQVVEKEPIEEAPEEKKSVFKKVTETFTKVNLSDQKFDAIFWDLEVIMLENNVAVEVIEKIKADLKSELQSGKLYRKSLEQIISETLKNSIIEILKIEPIDLVKKAQSKKPYIIAFIGVNGSGKTTSLAKVAKLMLDNGLKPVIAAADTFRAAAIQQLEEHANNLGVKLIKHDYNSDPAAVAYDAVAHAKAKDLDVVLIDTAGRLHSNDNLMNELKKLIRVNEPDMKIFVGESITGNDCVEQCKVFDEAVGIDGIILAKADVDEKGGAAISASFVTKRPILYLGTGQTYTDLTPFDPKIVVEGLGL